MVASILALVKSDRPLYLVIVAVESASFNFHVFLCPNRVINYLKTSKVTSINYVQYIAYTLGLFPAWASLSLGEGQRVPGQCYTRSVFNSETYL